MADCSDSRFAHHHRYSSSKQHCVVKPGAPVLHEMEAEVSLIGLIATEANSSILLATIAMDCSTRLRFEAERSLFHQSTGIDPWYYFHRWHDHGGKSTKYVHYKVYIRRGPARYYQVGYRLQAVVHFAILCHPRRSVWPRYRIFRNRCFLFRWYDIYAKQLVRTRRRVEWQRLYRYERLFHPIG